MCNKLNTYAEGGVSYFNFRQMFFPLAIVDTVPDTLYHRALYAQAFHETGGFSSRVWKETKNMFGMRPSLTRTKYYCDILETQSGKYATYDDFDDSIKDRIDLDNNFRRETDLRTLDDVRNYMDHVKFKGYATDPDYVQKWTNVYNQIFRDSDDPSDEVSLGNGGSSDYSQEGNGTSFFGLFKIKSWLLWFVLAGAIAFTYFRYFKKK